MAGEYKYHRRSIRLEDYDYSTAGAYFATICLKNNESLLGDVVGGQVILSPGGVIIEKCWKELPDVFANIGLDDYIIMPDHIHGVIRIDLLETMKGLINQTPTKTGTPLGKIIRYFKAKSSRIAHQKGLINFQWQRNYYEHIIRKELELNEIRKYIQQNPHNWPNEKGEIVTIFGKN